MEFVMYELMELCGFNFQATTFPELFRYIFMAICGTSILACIIKVMFYLALNTRRLGR